VDKGTYIKPDTDRKKKQRRSKKKKGRRERLLDLWCGRGKM